MRSQTQGRQDLLTWINEFTECDYPKIEMLSDGIAYCQVIDAIHNGSVGLVKLNYNARFPDEYTRNLKVCYQSTMILDDAFSKNKIDKPVPIDKLSKSKFQDNMSFLQWLFNYAQKMGPFSMKAYKGYQKRQDAYDKQQHGQIRSNECPFDSKPRILKPETKFIQIQEEQPKKFEELSKDLEIDLKNKMEYNWKLIYALDDIVHQRNVFYNLLSSIEQLATQDKSYKSQRNSLLISLTLNDQFIEIIGHPQSFFLEILVKAKSQASRVIQDESQLVVLTQKEPIEDLANKDVIKLLANHFNIQEDSISIIRGSKNRTKVINIKKEPEAFHEISKFLNN
ncbi:hypothetical protein pb186bvf_013564 [Paramecium bursaria]